MYGGKENITELLDVIQEIEAVGSVPAMFSGGSRLLYLGRSYLPTLYRWTGRASLTEVVGSSISDMSSLSSSQQLLLLLLFILGYVVIFELTSRSVPYAAM